MLQSMQKFLISISISLFFLLALPMQAQSLLPDTLGARVKYEATIEMKSGYLSGICVMVKNERDIKGCLFNEFGISALDFTYFPDCKKIKLDGVIKMLNKWYIKKVLKKNLLQLMENLQQGISTYHDEKYKINYNFLLLRDATEK